MTETSVNFWNITILEPVTVGTDLLLVIFCFYAFLKLKLPGQSPPLLKYWRLFFLIMAISTLVGAIAHGLKYYMSENTFKMVWLSMNLFAVLSSYFQLLATIEINRKESEAPLKKLQFSALIVTIIIAILTIIINDFTLIKIYAGIIVLLAIFMNYAAYKRGIKGSGFIAFGFTFSTLSLIVHTAKLSLHDYFNFKDISHIIMLISLYIIFRGVMEKTRVKVE